MSQDTSREHPTEVEEFQCLHPTLVKGVRGVPRLAPPFLSPVLTLFLVAKVEHAVVQHCHLYTWNFNAFHRYSDPVLLPFI